MSPVRIAPALILSLALGSCSPPTPMILAVSEGGKIVFHMRYPGIFWGSLFGYDDKDSSVAFLRVTNAEGEIVWQLGAETPSSPPCQISREFPIVYGEQRCNIAALVEAEPLLTNVEYEVALPADYGFGSYRMRDGAQTPEYEPSWGPVGRFKIGSLGVVNSRPR